MPPAATDRGRTKSAAADRCRAKTTAADTAAMPSTSAAVTTASRRLTRHERDN
jgi:hypothetical protein